MGRVVRCRVGIAVDLDHIVVGQKVGHVGRCIELMPIAHSKTGLHDRERIATQFGRRDRLVLGAQRLGEHFDRVQADRLAFLGLADEPIGIEQMASPGQHRLEACATEAYFCLLL